MVKIGIQTDGLPNHGSGRLIAFFGFFCLIRMVLPWVAAADPLSEAREELASAHEEQQRVLRRIDEVMAQQRLRASDGTLLMIVESLIREEQSIRNGIQAVGPTLVGIPTQDLDTEALASLSQLATDQEGARARYQRWEEVVGRNARERPDSIFVRITVSGTDMKPAETMSALAAEIRENRLVTALPLAERVLESLSMLRDMLAEWLQTPDSAVAAPNWLAFTPPNLVARDPTLEMGWLLGGLSPGAIDQILQDLDEIRRLVQQEEALCVRTRAQDALAESPQITRDQEKLMGSVLPLAGRVQVYDPAAALHLREARKEMQASLYAWSTSEAAKVLEKQESALASLLAAEASLKATYDAIMNMLMELILRAAASGGGGGDSGETSVISAERRMMILEFLRRTLELFRVTNEQESLKAVSGAAVPGAAEILAASQSELQVRLFKVQEGVEKYQQPEEDSLSEPLTEASHAMGNSAEFLSQRAPGASLGEQEKALASLRVGLERFGKRVQQLLGELNLLAAESFMISLGAGLALPGEGAAARPEAWSWNPPPADRQEIDIAFRGSFPARYENLIKLYYQRIARLGQWDDNPDAAERKESER